MYSHLNFGISKFVQFLLFLRCQIAIFEGLWFKALENVTAYPGATQTHAYNSPELSVDMFHGSTEVKERIGELKTLQYILIALIQYRGWWYPADVALNLHMPKPDEQVHTGNTTRVVGSKTLTHGSIVAALSWCLCELPTELVKYLRNCYSDRLVLAEDPLTSKVI